MDFLEIVSYKRLIKIFTDILPLGDALMNANKWTEMKQDGFYPERDKAHKRRM